MKRKLLIALLAFGTVAGYASGFRSLRHCAYNRGHHWNAPAAHHGCDDARR